MSARRALIVLVGLAWLVSACATAQRPRPRVLPPGARPEASAVVRTAQKYLGRPYRLGGTTPDGFDCSGFVWYVFRAHGIALPRTVASQAGAGWHVDRRGLAPGDLVFFRTSRASFSHVGLALGNDWFIHAPNAQGVVRIESLATSYWSSRYTGARRVTTQITRR